MRKALMAVMMVCLMAGAAQGFGNKDQGFVSSDMVIVIEHPQFYPAVDTHTHISGSEEAYELAVKSMDAAGVALSVNLSGASGESLDKVLELEKKYPGRFVTFCGVRASKEEWASEDIGKIFAAQLQEAHDKGAVGIGEIVKWQLFGRIKWDDERLEPMWNKLEELKMPINWHVGDPSRYWRPQGPYNMLESDGYETGFPLKQECLMSQERVMDRHPNLIVIGAHSNYLADQIPQLVYRLEKYPNYYIDLSAVCGEWGRVPYEFIDMCKKYGDRMFYGTDAGYRDMRASDPTQTDMWVSNFKAFHVAHFLFYGTRQRTIPIPWNGNYGKEISHWVNGYPRYVHDGVALPDDILRKIYYENFEKMFGVKVSDRKPAEGFSYEITYGDQQDAGGSAMENRPPAR